MTVSSWLYKEYSEQSVNGSAKVWYICKYYFQNIFNFSLKYFCNVSYEKSLLWKNLNFSFKTFLKSLSNGLDMAWLFLK